MRISKIAFSVLLALMPMRLFAQNLDYDDRTIATYLEEYPGNIFSDFVSILKKANLWNDLNNKERIYTCFAPTNYAISNWLSERKIKSIDNIPLSSLDTIARMHICKGGYSLDGFTVDREFYYGIIPRYNYMQRLLVYSYNKVVDYQYTGPETVDTIVRYRNIINERSNIISQDYLLLNGYVDVVDRVIEPSISFLPEYLDNNNRNASSGHKATLFYQALQMTGLSDTLEQFIDFSYPAPQFDSTYACLEMTGSVAVHYSTGYQNYDNGQYQRVIWPNERLFKYTLFVVSDSVLDRLYGIRTIDDLRAKARSVYPEGASLPDTDRNSSLNKLISYHILPCWLSRNMLNYTNPYVVSHYKNACPDSIDMQDFYETMHPYALMRISTPYDQGSGYNGKEIFINRKGTVSAGNLEAEGIRIWNRGEAFEIETEGALNGGYYYVDSLLLFDQHTKNALDTRIRVMFSTLSPDFINSGARGRMRQDWGYTPTAFAVYSFKEGYCKNITSSPETMFVVRYLDREWDIVYHDEISVRGNYDITFRLPPVPSSGLYEIRFGSNCPSDSRYRERQGSILYYISKDDNEFVPCGTPVDMTIHPADSLIGYKHDWEIYGQSGDEEEAKAAIAANDKLMRKNGYMRYPDSFAMGVKVYDRLRDHETAYRKIVSEMYMEAGKDYYLRLRQVNGDSDSFISLNFLELVPYSVYSGENGPEDSH